MNRLRFPVRAICCLALFVLLLSALGMVGAQDEMDSMDSMPDDMMEDAMMMMAPPRICTDLPGHIAVYSNTFGINCNNVGVPGIGVPSIIDAGVVSAIDFSGGLGVDGEVCFSIAGPITFLDAATSPRAQSMPDAYSRDNLTCIQLTGPGTVVLGEAPADDMMMDDDMMPWTMT